MKKLFAMFFVVLLSLSLSACSGNGAGKTSGGSEVTIPETVLVDEQGIKAVAKSFGKYESEVFPSDQALLIDVTNSTGRTVSVGLNRSSINGYMINCPVSFEIDTGETQTYPASFDELALKKYAFPAIADLEFCFTVTDAETYEPILETQPIQIKTSAADTYDYSYDESGEVIYDAEGIKITAKEPYEDEYLGLSVDLVISNQSGKNLSIAAPECDVNGKTVEPSFGADVMNGKHSISQLSFDEGDRPETIQSLTLSLEIRDWDDGEPIVEKTDPVTVTY